jgi:TRAP-type C4-dicarboxylate transport system permease small subunit
MANADEVARRSGFGRFLDAIYLASGWLAGAFLVLIFLIMVGMSAGRQFGLNIPAGDDFAAWSMAAMAFLGLAHTFKRGEMIRVGLLLDKVRGRVRWFFEMLALSIGLAFIAYFARYALQLVTDSWRFNDLAQGTVAMPLWIPQSAVFIGLAILAVAMLDELVHVARGNAPTFEKGKPQTPEEIVARAAEGGGV